MRFTIKKLMLATLIVAISASVSAPAITDLWSIRHYQTQSESMRKSMEKIGVFQRGPDTSSMAIVREYDASGKCIKTSYVNK